MKIEVSSQLIRSENLLDYLKKSNDDEVEFELESVSLESTRPIETVIVVAIIKSVGLGAIISTLINAVKDIKITNIKTRSNERISENLEKHEMRKLAYEKDAEFERLVMQGHIKQDSLHIQIVGNRKKNLILDKKKVIEELKQNGITIEEFGILVPFDVSQENLKKLNSAINLNAIQEIIHREV